MAPLLPPFLIMTGPGGQSEERGRLSEDCKWERRAQEAGREGSAEAVVLFWGEETGRG